jgi:hypothetical protein
MIREDVWQELLKQKVKAYGAGYKRVQLGLEDIQEHARIFWEACVKSIKQGEESDRELQKLMPDFKEKYPHREWSAYMAAAEMEEGPGPSTNTVAGLCKQDEIPFTVGLGSQWKAMVIQNHAKKLAKKDVESWLNTVAEMTLVYYQLYGIRYWWRPSFSCGPQYSDHADHLKFYKMLTKLTAKLHKEERLDE